MKEGSIAVVTFKDLSAMTQGGRDRLADWLRDVAGTIQAPENAKKFSKRFRARYLPSVRHRRNDHE